MEQKTLAAPITILDPGAPYSQCQSLSSFLDIPAITGVKSNITTFNYVCKFIVNMFYCGKILFNKLKNADIKGVK